MQKYRLTPAVAIVALVTLLFPGSSAIASNAPDRATCKESSSLTIRFDDETTAHTLDARGRVIPGPGLPRITDCFRERSSPAARTVKLGTWDFTPRKRSYSKSDSNSTFTAQSPVSPATLAWSWRPSIGVRKIARGTTITATVERSPGNCFYSKPGVSLDYFFHSSCRNHAYYSTYKLRGHWTFRVSVNGQKGTAYLNWIFQYAIVPQ